METETTAEVAQQAPPAPVTMARKRGRPRKSDAEVLPSGSVRTRPRNPLTGERESFTVRSKGEAISIKEDYKDLRARIAAGRLAPQEAVMQVQRLRGGIPTVRALWDDYVATLDVLTQDKARSIWRNQLEHHFGQCHVFELTTSKMKAWENALRANAFEPEKAQRTIYNAFVFLAAALRRAIGDHKIPTLPWGTWKAAKGRKSKREAMRSVNELERAIVAAAELDREKQLYAHHSDRCARLVVMTLCSLRQGEASGLGWDMVRIDEGPHVMRVWYQARRGWQKRHPSWPRPLDPPKRSRFKEDSRRELIMHPAVVAALRAQRDKLIAKGWYRPDGPVFPNRSGGWRADSDCLYPEDVREICERAGLPNLDMWTTHSLRHSGATLEVLASGGDFKAVAERTGHRDLAVLRDIYTHAGGRGQLPSFIGPVVPRAGGGPGEEHGAVTRAEPRALPPHAPDAPEAVIVEEQGSIARALANVDDAFVSLVNATVKEGAEYEKKQQEAKLERRRAARQRNAEAAMPLGGMFEAARDYVAKGGGKTPPAVLARANSNYTSAYMGARRKGESLEAQREAGKRARDATMLAWKNAVKKARAALGVAGEDARPRIGRHGKKPGRNDA